VKLRNFYREIYDKFRPYTNFYFTGIGNLIRSETNKKEVTGKILAIGAYYEDHI